VGDLGRFLQVLTLRRYGPNRDAPSDEYGSDANQPTNAADQRADEHGTPPTTPTQHGHHH
jgi:hypothetical protein